MSEEAQLDTETHQAEPASPAPAEQSTQQDTSTNTQIGSKAAESAPAPTEGASDDQGKIKAKTIAGGADSEEEARAKDKEAEAAHKPYWPDNWREKMAEHYAAGDKKAYKKELARLQRFTDPSAVYGIGRELENWRNEGGFIKLPGENATDEERAAYNKARGIPETIEDYAKAVNLDKGIEIGEEDAPVIEHFAQAALKAGIAPREFSGLISAYYSKMEDDAAERDTQDENYRIQNERALKEEWGPAFKRRANAIGTIFATAPGGLDMDNERGLFARLMGGRMADGTVIGNDVDMLRWLDSLRNEINPAATVVEDGSQAGLSIDAEIRQIEERMTKDRRGYFKDNAMQSRYRELLDAREKMRARG